MLMSSSTEKKDRYYRTRGSGGLDDNNKMKILLSSKEKKEDFMAMKGCKSPQRPKRIAMLIMKSMLLLSDLCQERYEVREKKTSKKRPKGLKAMGSMESDSE
ncbi:hypothetical protein RJ639_010691 [Escallonia herrerae]|uniref:Uncharacterized protein n=1 Tax=Escallonia herrerae TaxID=1293975 RepID=A0AA88VS58_9ASTE|nr:hypothetical protein RJ639_010691 [Escallonia herrerae]